MRDAPSGTTSDEAPSEEDWKQAVQQAAVQAKAAGNMSGVAERFAEDVVEPTVDWRSLLWRFAQEQTRADYSWRRPNPRYVAHGLYVPALWSEEVGPIVIGVDTSASIDQVMLAQFSAECKTIFDELKPTRVYVLYADTKVHRVEVFEHGDPFKLEAVGGGGTDFRPFFDEIEKLDDVPVCAVYLTDLYGPFPEREPDYPVLWACTSHKVAPWGETVPCNN